MKNFDLAVLLSVLLSILLDLALRLISRQKKLKENLKLTEKERAEDMFFSLATSTNYLTFFNNLSTTRHKSKRYSKFVKILHDDGDVLLYPYLSLEAFTAEKLNSVIKYLKRFPHKKIVIVTGQIDEGCLAFSKTLDEEVVILDKYETYLKLYKPYDFYPEITKNIKKDKKTTVKELMMISFNKKRVKGYLLSALLLLFASLFVRFNLYYSITASILVLFAIISLFNPFTKTKSSEFSL